MNNDLNTSLNVKVPFMDVLKDQLKGKKKIVVSIFSLFAVLGMSGSVFYLANSFFTKNINQPKNIGASNNSCYLELTITSPTPTATPTTPTTLVTATPTVRPTATPTVRPTATPTVRPTSTPTTRPTATPTVPPITSSCTNWGNNERSTNYASDFVKFSLNLPPALSTMSFVKTHSLSIDKTYNFESMDSHPVTGVLYTVGYDRSSGSDRSTIYTVNKTNGALVKVHTTASIGDYGIQDISFRNADTDGTFWAWVESKGIYKVNYTTGAMTLVKSSTLDNVEGMAWDSNNQSLWISRTPNNNANGGVYQLYKYDFASKSLAYYSALPGDTDALDWAQGSYLGGGLVGEYYVSSLNPVPNNQAVFFTYDVVNKRVKNTIRVATTYPNIDAFALCVN